MPDPYRKYLKKDIVEALREANEWLEAMEGINLLYHWPEHEAPKLRALVMTIVKQGTPDERV